ncbi:hypothetical protein HNV11_04465 [Spirosoma taeanense]|uniref:Uncharacterized protein n=1 Tax=Spirosoma taeanense TaxID=2735870 RepID=A0A6M5Y7J0_9BACT|nr:hypothetical protein [Spirosoma taeanense]QJW88682.1 hypothetical protein HNV11_04465 [Spirosoma taeanense]
MANDFKDESFSFPVESVLIPEKGFGKLVVEASEGYRLATSANDKPKAALTFDHVLQPDGNRVAKATILLITTKGAPTNGSVTIRNSLEKLVLPILGTITKAPETDQSPRLTVDNLAPTFPITPVGTPSFLKLTIVQQHTDTPVKLSTDTPALFQFASDNQSNFSSSLTFTPTAAGTPVRIRYSAYEIGVHKGQLTIEAPYDKKTLPLLARSGSVQPETPVPPTQTPDPTAEQWPVRMGSMGIWAPATAAVLIGIVAFVGYAYRCEISPALCQATTIEAGVPEQTVPETDPVYTRTTPPTETELPVATSQPEIRAQKPVEKPINKPEEISVTTVQPTEKPQETIPATPEASPKLSQNEPDQRADVVASRTAKRNPATTKAPKRISPEPSPAEAESELERELNQKPN